MPNSDNIVYNSLLGKGSKFDPGILLTSADEVGGAAGSDLEQGMRIGAT